MKFSMKQILLLMSLTAVAAWFVGRYSLILPLAVLIISVSDLGFSEILIRVHSQTSWTSLIALMFLALFIVGVACGLQLFEFHRF